MKKILFLIIGLFTLKMAEAQNERADTILQVVPISETVISATRSSQARSAVAQHVVVIRSAEIAQLNAASTADLIQNSGTAFVQKSQQGGGSPVLRGFEASRVLLVVDGIRMNNAIYRAGHLQNIITMDNAMLERAEILYGPASTVYGTDALGGAICFYTKNPVFSENGKKATSTGNAFFRYGTINQEKTTHADVSVGGKRLASILSFTYSDFGDLRMGKNPGSAGSFGERPFYVERIGGRDSLVRNADPYVQKFSGYSQLDVMSKTIFKQNDQVTHALNLQFSTSSNIPRYDRLTDPGAGGQGLASSEWYYGPQDRQLIAYDLDVKNSGWMDGLHLTASWQGIEESRHNRSFGATRINHRTENVGVLGLIAEGNKSWKNQTLRLGLDGQYNDVASMATRENVSTGEQSPQSTRYPDGGSTTYNLSLYATHSWQLGTWTFSEGLRAGFAALNATFDNKDFYPFPFDNAQQKSPVAAANIGAVWNGASGWRVALNASTGFRVPNVDDLGKIFDSAPGDIVVPNPDINPEKTLNFDLNITRQITDKLRWENVLWGTSLHDAIVTDVFNFNGQDSIEYDGLQSRVLANQNARKARLFGFSSGLEIDMTAQWAFYGSIAYTKGEIMESEENKPLDHIPPLYGRAGLRWHISKASVDAWTLFNGKKPIGRYNREGEDNEQYAPADGMPSWFTLNLRGSYRLSNMLTVQAGMDNLLDRQYRNFASGINAPGRNVWATVRLRW